MIYFDNAATTKPDKEALEKASVFNDGLFYNPSAVYKAGSQIKRELDAARESLLKHLTKSSRYGLIFTSSGTEADNIAILGQNLRGNIVTTGAEHSAVYNTMSALKDKLDVRFAKVGADGRVDENSLIGLVDNNTSLVSVIHAGNETGCINDINGLAMRVKEKNPRTVFHSDGVQAFGKLKYNLSQDVDMYCASAHKIGGIKGTGILVYKKALKLHPLIFGGGQESGLKSGTENVFGIKNFEYAAEKKFAALQSDLERVISIRNILLKKLDSLLYVVLSDKDEGSPYVLSVSAVGLKGEVLLRMLEERGLLCSAGAACSLKNRFSRVLKECGHPDKVLEGVVRLSFSPSNTLKEAEQAASILNAAARELKEKIG